MLVRSVDYYIDVPINRFEWYKICTQFYLFPI